MPPAHDDKFFLDDDADLPFERGLSDFLGVGVQLASATWTVSDATLLETHDAAIIESGQTARVWLRALNKTGNCFVTCHFETNETPPRKDERTWLVMVRER